MEPLKLIAFDGDDMEVVSAHLQDAVVKTADIRWRPAEKRLVIGLARFDWEAATAAAPGGFRRCRSALRFERVVSCQCRNVDAGASEATLNLLAIVFAESDPPGGTVTLTFSGGAALRVQVECLEAELADLGPAWATECCPAHGVEVQTQAHDAQTAEAKPMGRPQQG